MEYLEFAKELAVGAGHLIVDMWKKPLETISKDPRDVVTEADYASQNYIVQRILDKYPDHGFMTEEKDSSLPTNKEFTWIIDPIDGTINYSRGQPIFTVSIALAIGEQIHIGVIYDPLHKELFYAEKGKGFYLNKEKGYVSKINTLSNAVLGFDWKNKYHLRQNNLQVLNQIIHQVRTVNVIGSAALSFGWIAAGRMDGYFNFDLDVWDMAAGALLIREAGGRFVEYSGGTWNWEKFDRTCIATNGFIEKELILAIKNANVTYQPINHQL